VSATGKKCLVAYFSREGYNYVSGRVTNLRIGNTKVVAMMIAEIAKADLFCIDPVNPYPEDYTETTVVAQKEKRANARPGLSGHVKNMDSYDAVFLGYPNWWGTMPMAVCTFLEEYDFSGKTIIPFCTHEGSGLGRSESDIARIVPGAKLVKGLAILGSKVKDANQDIERWLGEIR
jgi:flavodoxin